VAEPKLTRFANILEVSKPTWLFLTESWAEGAHGRRERLWDKAGRAGGLHASYCSTLGVDLIMPCKRGA